MDEEDDTHGHRDTDTEIHSVSPSLSRSISVSLSPSLSLSLSLSPSLSLSVSPLSVSPSPPLCLSPSLSLSSFAPPTNPHSTHLRERVDVQGEREPALRQQRRRLWHGIDRCSHKRSAAVGPALRFRERERAWLASRSGGQNAALPENVHGVVRSRRTGLRCKRRVYTSRHAPAIGTTTAADTARLLLLLLHWWLLHRWLLWKAVCWWWWRWLCGHVPTGCTRRCRLLLEEWGRYGSLHFGRLHGGGGGPSHGLPHRLPCWRCSWWCLGWLVHARGRGVRT